MREYLRFLWRCFRISFIGDWRYLAWMTLLRLYPAGIMQSFTFLTPVWGVVLGVLLLGEPAGLLTALGMSLVGLGLLAAFAGFRFFPTISSPRSSPSLWGRGRPLPSGGSGPASAVAVPSSP